MSQKGTAEAFGNGFVGCAVTVNARVHGNEAVQFAPALTTHWPDGTTGIGNSLAGAMGCLPAPLGRALG